MSKYSLKQFTKKNHKAKPSSANICSDCGFRVRGDKKAHEASEHHQMKKTHLRPKDNNGKPREHVFGS